MNARISKKHRDRFADYISNIAHLRQPFEKTMILYYTSMSKKQATIFDKAVRYWADVLWPRAMRNGDRLPKW